jgi:diguanylate cyclase (GGDEF)-like protein
MSSTFLDFIKRWISSGPDRLAVMTDHLDLHKFVGDVLTWAHTETDANNVIWLRQDELQRFKEIASGHKTYEPDQLLHREVKIRTLKPVADPEIIEFVKAFDPESLMVQQTGTSVGHNYYLPVCDPLTNKIMAAVIIEGVRTKNRGSILNVSKGLARLAKHASFCLQHWHAQTETFCDDLTNLFNQKFMSQVLEAEIHRASRMEGHFAVLFMDIDHFKTINDHKGHWVGSKVLVELARVIRRHVRKSDYAFRYGGDEFVVILPETTAEGARVAGERIRGLIEATDFLIDGVHLKLTISIGVAGFPEHAKTHRDIIRMADEAMYCGKKSRNMVFVANS